jgi:hypothetical protein
MKRGKEYNRDKGIVLFIILALVAAITIVGLGFIIRGDTELVCGQNMELRADMDYLAESGLEHARGLILNQQDENWLTDDSWTVAGQQLVAGSSDYYSVTVSRLSSPFNYEITSSASREGSVTAQESLTAELRLNPCIVYWQSGNEDVSSSVDITGDAYFGDDITNSGRIDGDVYSAGTVVNAGQIGGQIYQHVSQTPCNTPGILPSSFSSGYYIGSNHYLVEPFPERDPNDFNSLTLSYSAANPAGIFYRNGNLTVRGNVIVNGTLVVSDNFIIQDANVTIESVKNFPALIVGKIMRTETENTRLSATGYTQIDEQIDMRGKSGCSITIYGVLYILGVEENSGIVGTDGGGSVSVTGQPHKACLAIWSSGGNLTRWSPAAGAFYKSIVRNP